MSGLFIGYARVSTEEQDLTAQRTGLTELGVDVERIYVDHGLTGTNRDRPGLREALAACRAGDTLVVTKLDRLARSLPDARAIAEDLTRRKVRLSLGASIYDPTDPVGRLLFNVLAMVAEFEADLIRSRTREGMRVAKAKGHLRGKQPKLNPRQEAHLVELFGSGEYTTAELGDLFGVARSTVYWDTWPPFFLDSTAAADVGYRPVGDYARAVQPVVYELTALSAERQEALARNVLRRPLTASNTAHKAMRLRNGSRQAASAAKVSRAQSAQRSRRYLQPCLSPSSEGSASPAGLNPALVSTF